MKAFLLKILITAIAKTWRISSPQLPSSPALIGFWHGKMLPCWYIFRRSDPIGVVSQSKDGSLLSSLLEFWNFRLIRGSSSKGGKEVMDQIVELLPDNIILMTPDGPRGPRQEMKAGILVASKKTQIPFYFLNVTISNSKVFEKAWDKFELPLPFSKIDIKLSEAIVIDKNDEKETINELLVEYSQKFKC